MEQSTPIYDHEAAAEIERLKQVPEDPFWTDGDARRALYDRAYNPPPEPDPTAGTAAREIVDTSGVARGFREPGTGPLGERVDYGALATELGVPADEAEDTAVQLRKAHFDLMRDPEAQRVQAELTALEVPPADQARYVALYFREALQSARTPTDPAASVATLRRRWGADYTANLNRANVAIDRLGWTARLRTQGDFFDRPQVIIALAEIGRVLEQSGTEYRTLQAALANTPYPPGHPERRKLKAQVEQLRVKRYGGGR